MLSKIKIAHSRRVFCCAETEKKIITLKDLDKGYDMYIKNNDVKLKKEEQERQRYIYNTLYS